MRPIIAWQHLRLRYCYFPNVFRAIWSVFVFGSRKNSTMKALAVDFKPWIWLHELRCDFSYETLRPAATAAAAAVVVARVLFNHVSVIFPLSHRLLHFFFRLTCMHAPHMRSQKLLLFNALRVSDIPNNIITEMVGSVQLIYVWCDSRHTINVALKSLFFYCLWSVFILQKQPIRGNKNSVNLEKMHFP